MANRIMLNQTSYHGAGAIAEIVTEAKAHAFRKAFVCSDPDLLFGMFCIAHYCFLCPVAFIHFSFKNEQVCSRKPAR